MKAVSKKLTKAIDVLINTTDGVQLAIKSVEKSIADGEVTLDNMKANRAKVQYKQDALGRVGDELDKDIKAFTLEKIALGQVKDGLAGLLEAGLPLNSNETIEE